MLDTILPSEVGDAPGLAAALRRMVAHREQLIDGFERRVTILEANVADREARIAALQAESAVQQAESATQQAELVLLRADRATLHRLVHDLAWPDGPRALRLALPVARLIRAFISGLRRN